MTVDEVNIKSITVISGLSQRYDTERRMLDSDVHLTREKISRILSRRFERIQAQRERSGTVALAASMGEVDNRKLYEVCSMPGYAAPECWKLKLWSKGVA